MADVESSPHEEISVVSYAPLLKYLGLLLRNVETDDEYVAFYGVPYAKSPAENLERYQAPKSFKVPVRMRKTFHPQTYDAREARLCSLQVMKNKVYGTQDCLHMNIFLPKRPELIDGLLPVLVYFHGVGGFTTGNNDPKNITPDSIIQHDVVFITVSYRLGLQGFFNMHTKICPGNAGLKDQVKALEWIRDNIENFKGDPKKVTISGCSAGATCVNLHLIAPMSKGLFHKAIVQSGGVYCPWGYRGHGGAIKKLLKNDWECKYLLFGELEGDDRLYERAQELLVSDAMIRHPSSCSPMYGPTTETIKKGAFIPEKIEEMMQAEVDPKIPILAGITKNEGLHAFSMQGKRNCEAWICDYRFLRLLTDNFRWSIDTALQCFDLLRAKYCQNVESMTIAEKKRCIAKLYHDIYFRRFYDNFKFGPEKTLHKNLFVYQFEHFSEVCSVDRKGFRDSLPDEPTHSDDIQYLYMSDFVRNHYKNYIEDGPEQNPEIKRVTNHMCSLWANFCKTGVPSSDFAPDVVWRRHTEEKPCYLRISADLHLKEGESLCEADWKWLNLLVNGKPIEESRPPTPELTDDSFAIDEPTTRSDIQYLYMSDNVRNHYKNKIEDGPEQKPEIERVMNHMCSLWANFCQRGAPSSRDFAPDVESKQHTEEKPCYLGTSADLHLKEGESLCEDDGQ